MKKVKIAFFAEILIEDFDGASRTMFQIIHRIPKDQFDFLFVCGVGPDEIEGYECLRVPALTIPINNTYKMAVPWFSGRRIRKKLAEFQPDVVHIATPSLLGNFALRYANRHQIPVLTIYHTHFVSYVDYYLKSSPRLSGFVQGRIAKSQARFYKRCDRIYVPSEEMKAVLLSWQVADKQLQIWRRGVNLQVFSPDKKDPQFMPRLTGNQQPVILFASRLVWEKNLATLCKIYKLLEERRLNYNLVIAGDGVALPACRTEMPGAVFMGKVGHEQLSVVYASADVFVFTSISEAFGNVVLEAMASGLPCVIADGGGSRNFIEQGVNGFLCAPNDAADYLDHIEAILQDPSLHSRFVEAGLRHSKNFDWEELANTYFSDLTQLAGGHTIHEKTP